MGAVGPAWLAAMVRSLPPAPAPAAMCAPGSRQTCEQRAKGRNTSITLLIRRFSQGWAAPLLPAEDPDPSNVWGWSQEDFGVPSMVPLGGLALWGFPPPSLVFPGMLGLPWPMNPMQGGLISVSEPRDLLGTVLSWELQEGLTTDSTEVFPSLDPSLSACPRVFRGSWILPCLPGLCLSGSRLCAWLSLAVGCSCVGWLPGHGSSWLPSIYFKQRFGLGFPFLERGAPSTGFLEGHFLLLGLL